jgi:crotonobetainyl-CoA:carnitine CoA-transferase CaiB-like acyl-CoA transferase
VELAQNLAGPFCARILGDLGATVRKIEPVGGDAARAWGPPFVGGVGTIFAAANAGKEHLALDLRSEKDRDTVLALVEGADVVVEALRPGLLDELGLGWSVLQRRNPRLILASILAYGEEGPLRDLPGYEPLMQAHGGMMSYTGEADGPPVRVGTSVVDMGTGMWAALGVLAALRQRDRTGRGTRVSGALFDTALTWSSYHLLGVVGDGTVAGRHGSGLPMICPYGAFPVRDGRLMIAVGSDPLFRRFCRALDLADLAADPSLETNPGRVAARDRVEGAVARATARYGRDDLLALLRGAGVPAAPILDVGEVLSDPQTTASGMLPRVPPGTGAVSPALPLRFDGRRPSPGTPAPPAPPDRASGPGTAPPGARPADPGN